jgi:hypothetical protein
MSFHNLYIIDLTSQRDFRLVKQTGVGRTLTFPSEVVKQNRVETLVFYVKSFYSEELRQDDGSPEGFWQPTPKLGEGRRDDGKLKSWRNYKFQSPPQTHEANPVNEPVPRCLLTSSIFYQSGTYEKS